MGNLESRIKQLEASGEDLSKLKGKTYDEFMKDITQGQKSMRKLEDEGLVRATAREIIGRDIKSGKIKLPKEIEQDIVQGGGEPINVFRQFYGEDALEQLDSMIPEFKNMYSPREAADAATKKFKFEFKADRPPGSISIEDAKKAEQEFINKPKQNEVDITAKVYRNTDPDELINEYNKNLDLLSQVDEEGGTLIGYQQFQKLQNRNTEIEKILNSIGIKSADSPEGKKITEALIGKPKASVTELVTAEKIISDMKKMDPMDAMKEANKVLKKEGKYKNLQEKDVERIMEDTNDFIFGRDIPEDPEGFAVGGRVGMAGERRGYADGDIASGLAIRLNRPVQPGDPIGSYYGGTPIMISNKKVEPTLNRDSQGRLVNSITGQPITTLLPLNRELCLRHRNLP
jgi:DNA-directed RNA polymerase subunit N (RpoN/RPB10)